MCTVGRPKTFFHLLFNIFLTTQSVEFGLNHLLSETYHVNPVVLRYIVTYSHMGLQQVTHKPRNKRNCHKIFLSFQKLAPAAVVSKTNVIAICTVPLLPSSFLFQGLCSSCICCCVVEWVVAGVFGPMLGSGIWWDSSVQACYLSSLAASFPVRHDHEGQWFKVLLSIGQSSILKCSI